MFGMGNWGGSYDPPDPPLAMGLKYNFVCQTVQHGEMCMLYHVLSLPRTFVIEGTGGGEFLRSRYLDIAWSFIIFSCDTPRTPFLYS